MPVHKPTQARQPERAAKRTMRKKSAPGNNNAKKWLPATNKNNSICPLPIKTWRDGAGFVHVGIEEKCGLLVLLGRGGSVGFEHALKMTLVGKAQIVGKVGDGSACAQACTRFFDARIHLVGMSRPACEGAKPVHEMVAAHVQMLRHLCDRPVQKIGMVQ